jgi:hypothetical protein
LFSFEKGICSLDEGSEEEEEEEEARSLSLPRHWPGKSQTNLLATNTSVIFLYP